MAIPPKPPPREAVPLVPAKPAHVGEYWPPEEDLSQADIVATLPPDEQAEILKGVDMAKLQYDFKFWGRPSQLSAVNSTAWVTVCLAGRGWGKSRVLSEAIHKYAMDNPGCRLLLLGRTAAEVREVMINGDSGVLNVVDPAVRPTWNQNSRKLTWPNGSFALCLSAEKPDALRGQQFHAAFCDEIGSYKQNPGTGLMNAFDQVKVATRLGEFPRIFVATTPRRVPIITELVEQAAKEPDKVKLIRGSTLANRALSAAYKEAVVGMYEGTALGRQELDGELLMDVEGALLQQSVIDDHRRDDLGPTEFWKELPFRVIGVDPSVTARPGDLCGIVAVGATGEKKLYKRHAFVLEDASLQGSPDVWAKKAVEMARKYKAVIVAEANQGGELVKMVIQGIDPRVPVTLVHAKVSKKQRADPVGACYERGAVHHVDWFTELEDELTTWSEESSNKSPDRLDAAVWAVTSLLVTPPKDWVGRLAVTGSAHTRHLPDTRGYDPHRAAEPRRPVGQELADIKKRLFDIDPSDPSEYGSLYDGDEENLPRRVIPSQRSIPLSIGGDVGRSRTGPFGAPSVKIRHR